MRLRTINWLMGSSLLAFGLAAQAETPSDEAGVAPSNTRATGGPELQEIVVTARRSEESLQDVPISIAVLNQADLDKRNITGTQDLGNYVPSLTVDNQFSGDAQSFSIRGFYQELSSTPTVGVYFADAPEPRGGTVSGTTSGDGVGAGQLFDLENIQVLKGPQGTLFGRNTTGGTILLVPAKPGAELGGYVSAGAGNYGMDREQAVVNLPLSENVRTRFGFDRMQRNGWQNNISGIGPNRMNETNYYALRGSIVVDIIPNLENYTVANFSVSNPVPGIDFVPVCTPYAAQIPGYAPLIALSGACQVQVARQNSHGFDTVQNSLSDTYQYTRQWQVVNTTTWSASDYLTLKNIASYSVFVNRYRGTIFGEYLPMQPSNPVFQPGGALAAAGSSLSPGALFIVADTSNAPGADNAKQRTVSEEIQAHGRAFDSRLDWQAGLYVEMSDPLDPSVGGPVQAAACTSTSPPLCGDPSGALLSAAYGLYVPQGEFSQNTIGITFHDYGVFSQASYKLLDNLTLTGGARYTWDNMSGYSNLINFFFPQGFGAGLPPSIGPVCFLPTTTTDSDCRVSSRSSSHAPTGLVDVEYKPVERAMLYAKYSRGYRQGGIQPRSAIPSYEPEKIDAFELGAKTGYGADDFAGTLDMAAFYNKLSNQQLQESYLLAGAFNQSLVNVGKSKIYGMEIDSMTRLYHRLRLDVSAAYLHTEIIEIGTADQVAANLPAALRPFYSYASGPTLHAPLPDAPNWRVSATVSYELPVPDTVGSATVGLTMVHTGDEYFTNPDDYTPPGGKKNYLPGQTLLNANFDWHGIGGSPVDLAVFCTNLTNKEYITHYLGGYNSVGFESARQGEPRMYGARLTYRFGGMKDR